jgi:hypothetical protein
VIGRLRLDDVDAFLALFERHHAAMGCDWTIDKKILRRTVLEAMRSPENWLCLFGDDCLMLAVCFESPLGAGMLAQELCFCASKGNRDAVIRMYDDWAKSKGCRTCSLSCIERWEVFERLYRRHGYALAETTFSKVL